MCAVQVWYKECFCSGGRNVRPIEKSFALCITLEGTLPVNSKIKLFPWYLCIENVFDWHLWSFLFLFGLVKLISGYQNLKSTCPKGYQGFWNFASPAVTPAADATRKTIGMDSNQLSVPINRQNQLIGQPLLYSISCLSNVSMTKVWLNKNS